MKSYCNEIFEIAKSMGFDTFEMMEKAKDYSQLVPEKKTTSDGTVRTYWVSPEDRNQGKMKGQQSLFGDEEMDQEYREDGFLGNYLKETEKTGIQVILRMVTKNAPQFIHQYEKKYTDYPWDLDTRDLDIKLDMDTAEYFKHIKEEPQYRDYYQDEYDKKTQRNCKILNNRKMKMARLKIGSQVEYQGKDTKIVGLSKRGFPMVEVNGKKINCFVEEIFDVNKLINKLAS